MHELVTLGDPYIMFRCSLCHQLSQFIKTLDFCTEAADFSLQAIVSWKQGLEGINEACHY